MPQPSSTVTPQPPSDVRAPATSPSSPPSVAESSLSDAFDLARALHLVAQDRALLAALAASFRQTSGAMFTRLESALVARRPMELAGHAHTLKGSALMFAADALAAATLYVEENAGSGQWEDLTAAVETVRHEHARLMAALAPLVP